MSDRTSPRDALERLAWHLNFHHEETVSLNRLAEATDLSWATVRKYVEALETQQRVAPQISLTDDGVEVGDRSELVAGLFDDKVDALAVYLLVNARRDGNATNPIDKETHSPVLDRYQDALEELKRHGMVEDTDEGLRLTPKGVRAAGPRASDITSGERDIHSKRGSVRTFEAANEIFMVHTFDADTADGTTSTTAEEWQQGSHPTESAGTSNEDDFGTDFGDDPVVGPEATN